jgi:hypothetical protein
MLPVEVLHLVFVLVLFPVQPVPTWIYPDELVTFVLVGEASNASAIKASPSLVTMLWYCCSQGRPGMWSKRRNHDEGRRFTFPYLSRTHTLTKPLTRNLSFII